MIATEIKVEQGTDEWKNIRTGLVTGSRFKDVLAKNKGKTEAAARRNYRAELVIERLTGITPERYISKAMIWGSETEELAAVEYMLKTGNRIETVGFFKHNNLPVGVSPDRKLVYENGCVEFKCFEAANHIMALRNNKMPAEHMPQVQAEIWFTGSDFCDFVSFVPELPSNAQLFIQRINRDDEYIKMMEGELLTFLLELEDEVRFIENYGK